jgi:hypothetical protein
LPNVYAAGRGLAAALHVRAGRTPVSAALWGGLVTAATAAAFSNDDAKQDDHALLELRSA